MRNAVAARRMLAKWARENEPTDPAAAGKFHRTVDAKRRRLEKAEEALPIRSLRIEVNWDRSRAYGAVPTATAMASLETGGFRAVEHKEAGYGYDLESSVVHQCLVEIPSFDRLVIEAGRKAWTAYAVESDDGFPRLSLRAKGMCALREFFEAAGGWKWTERHGKTWALYEVERK